MLNLPASSALLALPLCTTLVFAHAAAQDQVQETQTRGYWSDPSTGLMWASKDNGEDVPWKKAVEYCRELRVGGYPDWHLASLDELKSIYDKDAESPGLMGGKNIRRPATWHVKGGIFLTGSNWTSTRLHDDRGKPAGYAWRYDLNEGRAFDGDEIWFATNKRALCARMSSDSVLHKDAAN